MSREEAIKILKGTIKKPNTKDGYLGQALDTAIKALEQQPCDDAISREAVIDDLSELLSDWDDDYNVPLVKAIGRVEDSPSVTQKLGKWLYKEITDDYRVTGQCSECKERRIIDNFCPNCGAKMESEEQT